MIATGDVNGTSDWRAALRDVDAVIHCAARVHILEETAADPLQAFRDVNVAGTANLARQAADAGVKQFLFLSSIGARIAGDDPAATPYQISKLEAEAGPARDRGRVGHGLHDPAPATDLRRGCAGQFRSV